MPKKLHKWHFATYLDRNSLKICYCLERSLAPSLERKLRGGLYRQSGRKGRAGFFVFLKKNSVYLFRRSRHEE